MRRLIGCLLRLQHFLLLIVIAGLAGCYYYIASLPEEYSLQAGGAVLTRQHLMIVLGVGKHLIYISFNSFLVAFLVLLLTDIGSAFFWLVGLSALVIGIHAAFHEVSIESDFGQTV